jgi:hypothetical protein
MERPPIEGVFAGETAEAAWSRLVAGCRPAPAITEEMVERAARGIMDDMLWPGAFDEGRWGGHDAERDQWRRHARAALTAALSSRAQPAQAAASAIAEAERRGWLAGRDAAAKILKDKWEDYAANHGFYDPTTGVTEYPGNGYEWVGEWQELEDEIRALTPPEMQRGLAGDMGELISAAQDVLDETDKILAIDPPPIKFRAPYGTLARLRGVLNRLSSGSGLQEGGGDE